jgi:hypothetical protein
MPEFGRAITCRLSRNFQQLSSPGFEIGDVRQPFILRRNIGEPLELGARKIAFFERNEVHSSALLKHDNVFYRVKKGDLFEALSL